MDTNIKDHLLYLSLQKREKNETKKKCGKKVKCISKIKIFFKKIKERRKKHHTKRETQNFNVKALINLTFNEQLLSHYHTNIQTKFYHVQNAREKERESLCCRAMLQHCNVIDD